MNDLFNPETIDSDEESVNYDVYAMDAAMLEFSGMEGWTL
jgi:hypothetical protein